MALVRALQLHDQVNAFALSSNPCECFFGLRKQETRGKKDMDTLAKVIKDSILLDAYLTCTINDPRIPGRRN